MIAFEKFNCKSSEYILTYHTDLCSYVVKFLVLTLFHTLCEILMSFASILASFKELPVLRVNTQCVVQDYKESGKDMKVRNSAVICPVLRGQQF